MPHEIHYVHIHYYIPHPRPRIPKILNAANVGCKMMAGDCYGSEVVSESVGMMEIVEGAHPRRTQSRGWGSTSSQGS